MNDMLTHASSVINCSSSNSEKSEESHKAAAREEILAIAARTADLLLRNGAETYRVEETISRICLAYGYMSEPFALPTGIFASISGEGAPLSIVRRIGNRTIHLEKVAKLNDFARKLAIKPLTYEEAMKRLDVISSLKTYPKIIVFLSYSLSAAIFTLLYQGTLQEAGGALLIGALLALLRLVFMHKALYPFLEYFTGGMVAGFFSLMFSQLVIGVNAYIVITGALINLMPGTALVNGIRDMLHGDSVSGIARLGEAILTVSIMAAGTAIGVGTAISLFQIR